MEIATQIALAFVCLAAGGVLKGATGAGAPILAVPALAMMFDVRFAVVAMLVPNLLTNLWQAWRFRGHVVPGRFVLLFAFGGATGAIVGSVMLSAFAPRMLLLIMAFAVFAYVGLRLARPGAMLPMPAARTLSLPAGVAAGVLQGAAGLSAPVSLTFLNAIGLSRDYFISTASIFFAAVTAAQISALGSLGILTYQGLFVSLFAMLPIFAFMPVGAALARRFSKQTFDRIILCVLALLACKLLLDFWMR